MESGMAEVSAGHRIKTDLMKVVERVDVGRLHSFIPCSSASMTNKPGNPELAAALRQVIDDLKNLIVNMRERRIRRDDLRGMDVENIVDVLYYIMLGVRLPNAKLNDKLMAVQAAQIVALLCIYDDNFPVFFNSKIQEAAMEVLKQAFRRIPPEMLKLENQVLDFIRFIDRNVSRMDYSIVNVRKLTTILVSLTEFKADFVLRNFGEDDLAGLNCIRSESYTCLVKLDAVLFNGRELYSPIITAFLQGLGRHFLEVKNETVATTTCNYLLYLQGKHVDKFDNFLQFIHKVCVEGPLDGPTKLLVKYAQKVIETAEPKFVINIFSWMKRLFKHYDVRLRKLMNRIVFSLILKPPGEIEYKHYINLLSSLCDVMGEACLDSDDEVQNIAIRNLEKCLIEPGDETVEKHITDVYTYPSAVGKKTLHILETLIYTVNSRSRYLTSYIRILYGFLSLSKGWIIAKSINMIVTLFDIVNNQNLEKRILKMTERTLLIYGDSSAAMALYISIYIPEVLHPDIRRREYASKVVAKYIFDGIQNSATKNKTWQLISLMIKQNYPLDDVVQYLAEQYPITSSIGEDIVCDLLYFEGAARFLGSLARYIPNFEQSKLAAETGVTLTRMYSYESTGILLPSKFPVVEKFIPYLSVQHIVTIQNALYNALDKSIVPIDNIPPVASLLSSLSLAPSNVQNESKLADLQKIMERRVFNKLSRVVNNYNSEDYEVLLRDLLTLGHIGMRCKIMPDSSTAGLLALFVTPGHHGGLSDFFVSRSKAWTISIQSFGRLCMRDPNKQQTCIQVMRRCLKTPVPEVQIQALFILFDICALNDGPYAALRDDLFELMCHEEPQVRMASLEMIIKLHKQTLIQFESLQHLQFILGLCDPCKPIVNMIEYCIDEKYCQTNHNFIIDDLIKIVVLNHMPEENLVYNIDRVRARLHSLTLLNKKYIYFTLCCQLTQEQKITLIGYVVRMFIDAYCDHLFEQAANPDMIIRESLIILLCAFPIYSIKNLTGSFDNSYKALMSRKLTLSLSPEDEPKKITTVKRSPAEQAVITHMLCSLAKLWDIIDKDNQNITYGMTCLITHTLVIYNDLVEQLFLKNQDVENFLTSINSHVASPQFQQMMREVDENQGYVVKFEEICHWADKEERIRKQHINALKRDLNTSCMKYV